jgi:hypothetical protein
MRQLRAGSLSDGPGPSPDVVGAAGGQWFRGDFRNSRSPPPFVGAGRGDSTARSSANLFIRITRISHVEQEGQSRVAFSGVRRRVHPKHQWPVHRQFHASLPTGHGFTDGFVSSCLPSDLNPSKVSCDCLAAGAIVIETKEGRTPFS